MKAGDDEKLYHDIKILFERIKILMQYGCFGVCHATRGLCESRVVEYLCSDSPLVQSASILPIYVLLGVLLSEPVVLGAANERIGCP